MIGRLNLTDLSKEETRYRSKIEKNEDDDHSWFMLAQVYQRQRRLDQALDSYAKAITLRETPEYHFKLGELLFDQAKYSKSLHHLLEASKLTDDSWQYQQDLSDLIARIYEYDSC